jgi:hypothetical protein
MNLHFFSISRPAAHTPLPKRLPTPCCKRHLKPPLGLTAGHSSCGWFPPQGAPNWANVTAMVRFSGMISHSADVDLGHVREDSGTRPISDLASCPQMMTAHGSISDLACIIVPPWQSAQEASRTPAESQTSPPPPSALHLMPASAPTWLFLHECSQGKIRCSNSDDEQWTSSNLSVRLQLLLDDSCNTLYLLC